MIKERFTGIIVPSGLNLSDNYKCGEIITPISDLDHERLFGSLFGLVLDIGASYSAKNVEEVVENLKNRSIKHIQIAEQRNLSWPASEVRLWREYLNFVRSEYVSLGQQIPIINETLRVNENLEVFLGIYDLTKYNVGRECKDDPLEISS